MTKKEIKIGSKVKSLTHFVNINIEQEGIIVEDYGTGILIAWKPLPINKTPQEIAKMFAVNPECPDRDGFGYDELKYLEVIPPPPSESSGLLNNKRKIRL